MLLALSLGHLMPTPTITKPYIHIIIFSLFSHKLFEKGANVTAFTTRYIVFNTWLPVQNTRSQKQQSQTTATIEQIYETQTICM